MGTSSQPTGKHKGGKGALLDDEYMMMTYKVIPCSRVSTHNWKLCHFSHIGEVAARRRHPSCHQADLCAYVSANKECPDGDKCRYAHNAFESWLHPDRYKTTLCSYAGACTRKFCFFAHSAAELRQPSNKQHSAAAAGGMACHPELRLNKMYSLNTNPSIGTPNSSSSNMSSSSAQGMHISWVPGTPLQVSVGSNAAAAAAAAAGMYVQQMQPIGGTATGIPVSSCLPGGMHLPIYQAAAQQQQQQQQLMTAFIDSSNSSSLLAGPPGLSPVVVNGPQLAAAAAAAAGNTAAASMQMGGGFTGNTAGMRLGWDSLALAQLASLGTPMATDSSNFSSTSLLFDPASPSTPLTANSISPTHSPMVGLTGMTANAAAGNISSSGMRTGSLQHAFDNSSHQQQQQHHGQLRQQLLQHLMNVQQQKQPQQQQQNELPADMGRNWSLASVDTKLAAMLSLNQQSLQLNQSNLAADAAWLQYTLQQDQQQLTQLQQQQQAISGLDVQVLPGPQGFKPVGQASAGQQNLSGLTSAAGPAVSAATAAAVTEGAVVSGSVGSDSNTAAFLSASPEAAQQLQQQLNMLSFAMAQPA